MAAFDLSLIFYPVLTDDGADTLWLLLIIPQPHPALLCLTLTWDRALIFLLLTNCSFVEP